MVDSAQKAQKPARSGASTAIDHAAFEADLRQLHALLADSDMAAMTLYDQIKPAGFKLAPQRFKRLDAAMAALDFAAAARCCDEMLN